jgi:hypothetical protein
MDCPLGCIEYYDICNSTKEDIIMSYTDVFNILKKYFPGKVMKFKKNKLYKCMYDKKYQISHNPLIKFKENCNFYNKYTGTLLLCTYIEKKDGLYYTVNLLLFTNQIMRNVDYEYSFIKDKIIGLKYNGIDDINGCACYIPKIEYDLPELCYIYVFDDIPDTIQLQYIIENIKP